MVSLTKRVSDFYGSKRKLPGFCRKIGLVHNNSRQQLPRAADMAEKWFADHDGELVSRSASCHLMSCTRMESTLAS